MARRTISIEEKITQQEAIVAKAKERYEDALADLELLTKKRDELRSKELMDAIAESDRSFDEILTFLRKETAPETTAE